MNKVQFCEKIEQDQMRKSVYVCQALFIFRWMIIRPEHL